MKNSAIVLLTSLLLPLSLPAVGEILAKDNEQESKSDSRIEIVWENPEKFTDTRSANMSASKHREHIFEQLEAHMVKLSDTLPDGQVLRVKVTNLDLAGRVEPGRFTGLVNTMDDIRIIREIDIPRITFSYELFSAEGELLKEENVKLKDMNFMRGPSFRPKDAPFAYEKRMLTEWFEDNLSTDKA